MKINTTWDLKKHYYQSATDPKIEADIVAFEKACADFAKKYTADTRYLSDPQALLDALTEQENISEKLSPAKPIMYFNYRTHLDAKDAEASARVTELLQRIKKSENEILFFNLHLGKIPKETQTLFLKNLLLAKYRYSLEQLFENAKHTLSLPEEKVINLLSGPAHSMWVQGVEEMLNKKTIKWKGKEISLGEASSRVRHLPTAERKKMYDLIIEKDIEGSEFAAAEMNAIVTEHKIQDELRGFEKSYSATLLSYETKEETLKALREAVKSRVDISHRFYTLKAKILGTKKLRYYDRSIPIGKIKKQIPFEKAYEIVRESFEKVDPEFVQMFLNFFQNSQVDVFPKPGKHSGAYCWPAIGLPTFILLNHIPDQRAVSTLAHEMGHAIHTELSKRQPSIYQDYSTAVAEVASTLFENFAFEKMYEESSAAEKKIMLFERVADSMSVVFRQIACFEFEVDLHTQIREKGKLTREEMAALMNKHMGWYLGPNTEIRPQDGYIFVQWSHIRSFFYVYSYAFGELISSALYGKYKQDPKTLGAIKTFLSAGSSMSPEDIFKTAGLDITKPAFWHAGLDEIEARLTELEALYTPAKKTLKRKKVSSGQGGTKKK